MDNSLYQNTKGPGSESPEDLRRTLNVRLREQLFLSLLRREGLSEADIAEECKGLELRFISPRFALLSIKIAAWEKSFYSAEDSIPERIKRFIRFIILNVTEELLAEENLAFSLVVDGNYCCLINLAQNDEEYGRLLADSAKVIEQTLAEHCGVTVQLDASAVVEGLPALADAYDQIKDIEAYRRLLQNDTTLLTWRDVSTPVPFKDHFTVERSLQELTAKGEYDKVKEGVLELMGQMFTHVPNYHTVNFLFVRTQSLLRSLADAASRQTGSPEFWQEMDTPRMISDATSVQELEDVVARLFERLDEYGRETGEVPKWLPQLMEMLETGYSDPDINVSTLADRLGLSPAYLSRTFRKFRGIGLPDFIHILRISAAKNYIEQGYSIKKVTELVGYSNQLTMSRAFKKFEGITPGKYPY